MSYPGFLSKGILQVGVQKITPEQVKLNWQATGGISLSALLTRNLYFEVEPQARYYYGSIYEKSGNAEKPWSIGLKASIFMKF